MALTRISNLMNMKLKRCLHYDTCMAYTCAVHMTYMCDECTPYMYHSVKTVLNVFSDCLDRFKHVLHFAVVQQMCSSDFSILLIKVDDLLQQAMSAMTSYDDDNTLRRHNSHLYDIMSSSPYGTLSRRTLPRCATASLGSQRSLTSTRCHVTPADST